MIRQRGGIINILCFPGSGGFGFFNVTNLTMSSLFFDSCSITLPESAVKYINSTNQFLYYRDTETALILNHYYNVTLHNVLFQTYLELTASVIGVNLCGYSTITFTDSINLPVINDIFYFADSDLMSSNQLCNLQVTCSTCKSTYNFQSNIQHGETLQDTLSKKPNRIPIPTINGISLILTQQNFNAHVNMRIPESKFEFSQLEMDVILSSVVLLFVNSITESNVTYQGNSFQKCIIGNHQHGDSHCCVITKLSVYFYETPSFNDSVSKPIQTLTIVNTSFVFYSFHYGITTNSFAMLHVCSFSGKIKHQIHMESVCQSQTPHRFICFFSTTTPALCSEFIIQERICASR